MLNDSSNFLASISIFLVLKATLELHMSLCLSAHPLQKPLILSESCLSAKFSLLAVMPISHQATHPPYPPPLSLSES